MSSKCAHILFVDSKRQDEIDSFYDAAQMHRNYYRMYPKAYHPLAYFRDPVYAYQCPPEMSSAYLSFPSYHVRYKQPALLPPCSGRTSGIPAAPDRTLAGRYSKAADKAFVR